MGHAPRLVRSAAVMTLALAGAGAHAATPAEIQKGYEAVARAEQKNAMRDHVERKG